VFEVGPEKKTGGLFLLKGKKGGFGTKTSVRQSRMAKGTGGQIRSENFSGGGGRKKKKGTIQKKRSKNPLYGGEKVSLYQYWGEGKIFTQEFN